ncbi:SusC/RagA family TonB-linked outer membrane protein [Chitinophaga qingshengii]|uniref:SusC/RagA family TonB-linked outer membrane protein n=1 Tax=Chitinophaga qingshengii TaxID=1569794 RepID=A0ABR7TP86_9BACT|nr:SusC/RagA family TonB-linked outer membrane protein [Chitinophaga qingshengii]MBC9932285.1 SusC/RagA family TonB-linked outer membrane protein [Chitinophaga qingshengii]
MKHLLIVTISFLCCFGAVKAQNVVITGSITDKEKDRPLPGVSILMGNPPKAIGVGDNNGNFSVTVPANAEIMFKMIGYKVIKIKASAKQHIQIRMEVESNALKEYVAIGYQKKTRETATGASVSISGKDLQSVPVPNVMELLQGKVAGLNIQNNSGAPGARGSMFLRGLSSIGISGGGGNDAFLTPTSPLFVIDGVPIDPNTNYEYGFQQGGPGLSPLSLIPTEDIESVDVLKDSQATSLYGARGAYGVILITTKRGNSKTPIIQYTTNFFANFAPKLKQIIGGKDEREMRIWQIMRYDSTIYAGRENINNSPFLSDSLNAYYNNSTNWQDIFYRTTFNQTHNVSASGGDQRFNYKANLGYYNEKGIIENTGFDRYSLSMNTQFQPTPRFRLFTAVAASLGKNQKGSGNGVTQSGVASASNTSSLLPASKFTGGADAMSTFSNRNDNKTANIRTNIEVQYELLKGLNVNSNFSYDYTSGVEDNFRPSLTNNNFAQVYTYDDRRSSLYNRNMLTYVKSINDKHNFNIYGFNELNVKRYQAQIMQQERSPNDQYEGPLGVGGALSKGGILNNFSEVRTASFAGSFSYNYDKKYVVDFSYRWDAASSNGPDVAYTRNPSVGLRWNFNKENLLKDLKWLDFGSLRGSWGKNIVPSGNIFDAYGKYNFAGRFNNSPAIGLDFGTMPNTMLLPTVTTQLNGGFEIGLFEGKVSLITDVYYKMVDNMTWNKKLANHNGFTNIKTNEASMVNYGYEVSLMVRPLPRKCAVNWTLSFNGAINHDVLARLPDNMREILVPGDKITDQSILYRLGRNSLSNVLYHTRGVFANDMDVPVDPATGLRYRTSNNANSFFRAGDPYWTDVNGDYILDTRDQVVVGNSQPAITGGVTSYTTYKNFSLNITMSYTAIRDILNNSLAQRFQNLYNPYNPNALVPIDDYNYWKSAGDKATYPNPMDYKRYELYYPYRYNQTLFQEDGSYFKINTMTLSYNIDRNLTKRWGITSLRVYSTVNNVYTFSRYSGPDPENVTDLGRDRSDGYPNRRSVTLGLNVQF